ncbi:hypothetical protein ACP4OV_031819 [Aristida adscensionis]
MASTPRLSPLLLSLLVAVLAGAHHAALASSVVETTCATACNASGGAAGHGSLASFCVSSLRAAPGSTGADARGLAAIATNLTLANYTAAVATVKALQRRGGWPAPERGALATCRRRYIEALNVVHSAVHALAVRRDEDYVADMAVVRSAATDCDDAFGGGKKKKKNAMAAAGESPMQKVNDDALKLTTVAMLIVKSL